MSVLHHALYIKVFNRYIRRLGFHYPINCLIDVISANIIYSLMKCRDSELVRYHAKQSGMLLLAHIMNGAVGVMPVLGKPLKKINTALLIVLAFLGARNAYFNKKEPVPIVGKLISQFFR